MEAEHALPTESGQANDKETPASRHCPKINTKLLPYKCFYFLFFSAVGCIFPYFAIFYKQLWLSAQETGILIGMRFSMQFVSNSVWGIVADRFGKPKLIFMVALAAWLSSNCCLSLVKRPIDHGPCDANGTRLTDMIAGNAIHVNTETTKINSVELHNNITPNMSKRSHFNVATKEKETIVKQERFTGNNTVYEAMLEFEKQKKEQKFDELNTLGHSPWSLQAITNFKVADETATSTTHHENDGIFLLLLFITVVGNFVASPAIPLADTATLQILGDDKDFYGKQRQWGALGWGVSSFAVGAAVSTIQEKSNCNDPGYVDYMPCFYAFGVLMIAAFVPAMFFRFEDRHGPAETNVLGTTTILLSIDCMSFFATIWLFGCMWGLVKTFLLWHLQDLGGTQFLFSIIAATQCLSEVVSYQSTGFVTRMVGHHRVLYIGLVFSSLRLIAYGVIKNPWLVLPIELFHGVSTTLVWSLAVSFVGLNPGATATMQGVLSGVHWGLGVGGGSILGGVLVHNIGSSKTFITFGIVSLVNFLVLVTTRNLKYFHSPSEESRSLLERHSDDEYESIPLESKPTSEDLP